MRASIAIFILIRNPRRLDGVFAHASFVGQRFLPFSSFFSRRYLFLAWVNRFLTMFAMSSKASWQILRPSCFPVFPSACPIVAADGLSVPAASYISCSSSSVFSVRLNNSACSFSAVLQSWQFLQGFVDLLHPFWYAVSISRAAASRSLALLRRIALLILVLCSICSSV